MTTLFSAEESNKLRKALSNQKARLMNLDHTIAKDDYQSRLELTGACDEFDELAKLIDPELVFGPEERP